MSLEHYLISYCAPTLASLKTANLFRLPWGQEKAGAAEKLGKLRGPMGERGVSMEILNEKDDYVLLYVYRRSFLERDLKQPGVQAFLRQNGYRDLTAKGALERLRERFAAGEGFPHEIGLFLGYPLCDVIGFIENRGQGSKCCGCWKVYGDEQEAKKQFARYDKCSHIYQRLFREGRSLWQLTVTA
mgnify:CR=1 FL=1